MKMDTTGNKIINMCRKDEETPFDMGIPAQVPQCHIYIKLMPISCMRRFYAVKICTRTFGLVVVVVVVVLVEVEVVVVVVVVLVDDEEELLVTGVELVELLPSETLLSLLVIVVDNSVGWISDDDFNNVSADIIDPSVVGAEASLVVGVVVFSIAVS